MPKNKDDRFLDENEQFDIRHQCQTKKDITPNQTKLNVNNIFGIIKMKLNKTHVWQLTMKQFTCYPCSLICVRFNL